MSTQQMMAMALVAIWETIMALALVKYLMMLVNESRYFVLCQMYRRLWLKSSTETTPLLSHRNLCGITCIPMRALTPARTSN